MARFRFQGPPSNMIAVVAFVVTVVAAILALISGLQTIDTATRDYYDPWVVVALGVVALVAASMMWNSQTDMGGALAVACGIGFLILWPENAGLFALLGGVTALVGTRMVRPFAGARPGKP